VAISCEATQKRRPLLNAEWIEKLPKKPTDADAGHDKIAILPAELLFMRAWIVFGLISR